MTEQQRMEHESLCTLIAAIERVAAHKPLSDCRQSLMAERRRLIALAGVYSA